MTRSLLLSAGEGAAFRFCRVNGGPRTVIGQFREAWFRQLIALQAIGL